MQGEVLRIVEALHREKEIDKETIFKGVEAALQTAAKKIYRNDVTIAIDRNSGKISAFTPDGQELAPPDFGRIGAQAAKQLIIQKIREAERDVIYEEFALDKFQIVNGCVLRYDRGDLIVNLSKAQGVLPIHEQVTGETYYPGDRIRVYLLDVKKIGQRVKIILSRSHPNFVRKLFELEVPEIAQKIIEINSLVREAGFRTKIAVSSQDSKVECIGACIGVRGARIKNILDELGGEKIDIIRWDSSPEILIRNALKPAEVVHIMLEHDKRRAKVFVNADQQPLAIGKDGQNVRLASRLCKWEIDILSENEIPSSSLTINDAPPLGENQGQQ